MLNYSRCCDFYRCPYLFQCHDDVIVNNKAIQLGANIDSMINLLMIKHIKDPVFQRQKAIELGVSDMLMAIANNNDLCEMIKVPKMIKDWYTDFIDSGLEVVDIQKHFVIGDLDYHGYIDLVLTDGTNKFVVENKTTSRAYDKYMSSKKNSYQAVGYAMAEGTNKVIYQFFDTKTMNLYYQYPRLITSQDFDDFKEWVNFVKQNENCVVKNMEYCSLNMCPAKEMCNG